MQPPEGFIETFSRPHLVAENEHANLTIRRIHESIQGVQRNTTGLQARLGSMRRDGKSSLEEQTQVIRRISANNASVDDMGRQIGKLQVLVRFNVQCVRYIDWLKGAPSGDPGR